MFIDFESREAELQYLKKKNRKKKKFKIIRILMKKVLLIKRILI